MDTKRADSCSIRLLVRYLSEREAFYISDTKDRFLAYLPSLSLLHVHTSRDESLLR